MGDTAREGAGALGGPRGSFELTRDVIWFRKNPFEGLMEDTLWSPAWREEIQEETILVLWAEGGAGQRQGLGVWPRQRQPATLQGGAPPVEPSPSAEDWEQVHRPSSGQVGPAESCSVYKYL